MAVSAENYQLKWHSFTSYLHTCVASSLAEHAFADVSLYTMDGHHIMAHRFVLSACSQYLHQIFKMQHKINTTLPLLIIMPPEINYKTLKTLIQYMYSGETTVSKDILENVLRGGDILKVRGLWRPKEEEQFDKKLVKVHQKQPENVPSEQSASSKKPEQTNCAEKSVIKTTTSNIKTYVNKNKENKNEEKSNQKCETNEKVVEENGQYLMIKEEPIDWSENNEAEMEVVDEKEMFQTEMTIKPEILLDSSSNEPNEEMYSPLTCELCTETFTHPADWVKHIQSHTDMLPAKRQRHGRQSEDDENATFPPLHCDLCQEYFSTPADWVHHIQNTHTEFELRLYNKTSPSKPVKVSRQAGALHNACTICNKMFPSNASMLIHRRTHTGEKPYMCKYCSKGFNVKSNLLRHLRTLHDKIINSTDVESKDFVNNTTKNNE